MYLLSKKRTNSKQHPLFRVLRELWRSCVTANPEWTPLLGLFFLVGKSPFRRSGGSKFRRGSQISSPFLGLHLIFGNKNINMLPFEKIIKIIQWIDQRCMSFDTSSFKNVLLTRGRLTHRKNRYFSGPKRYRFSRRSLGCLPTP